MAKKALEDPPSVSSSDDDEISSEDEPKEPVTVNPTANQEDSDSDSDSEDESKEPDVSPNRRSGSVMKRRSEGTSTEINAKKAKTGQKSSIIRRLWTEDDEITLLQRLIDFNADKGTNPFEDKVEFFEFVKKEISFVVNMRQVLDKIRKLKKKYIGIGNYKLVQAHDKNCLRLVKYIWRPNGTLLLNSKNVVEEEEDNNENKAVEEGHKEVFTRNGEGSGKKLVEEDNNENKAVEEGHKEVFTRNGEVSGKKLVEEDEVLANGSGGSGENVVEEGNEDLDSGWFEKSVLVKTIASYGVAEHIVKERWSLFSAETKKELEEKWKSLESKQLQVVSEMIKYKSELVSKFAEAI